MNATRQLTLATIAFTVCFYGWSLLGPLSPDLQDHLDLSDSSPRRWWPSRCCSARSCGSRSGGSPTATEGGCCSSCSSRTPLPLVALALWHDSLAAMLAFGFLLGFAGASFAIGVPFVNGWYTPDRQGFALGIYGMGMGGTVLAGLTAPRISDHWGLAAPFWVAAGLLVVTLVAWVALAHNAPRERPAGPAPGMFASLSVFRVSGRAWALTLFYFLAFGGFVAMFLYLPKLLTGVHDLTKADAGARAAGFALLAVIGRPSGGALSDRIGADRVLLVSFVTVTALALVLAVAYTAMVPLTIACLTMAVALGLGMGATFKLVPEWFPDRVGSVTGVVGAAGGLGGFFPPLIMGAVKSATGGYALGFVLMALVGVACLIVLWALRPPRASPSPIVVPTATPGTH
jgi:NNP family nitrate/nitrite transporter-like MFS transporter